LGRGVPLTAIRCALQRVKSTVPYGAQG
jgi:hypothetical protein